jgi:FG-GAP repeat
MPRRRTVNFLALLLLVALAVSAGADFNDDGVTDLAVGAPAEDVSGGFNAGAVSALYGAAGGLSTAGGQLFTRNSPGVRAAPRTSTPSAATSSAPADQWITFDASWP